ncbi:hypothetical protein Syun_004443 [Stephania yunnanensis]|uniref:Uncharacterized protein n=1 Tax=Stephania yunnanensis TaxID=152371 RepID=A0AAP0Q4Y6_9MAGN
MDHSQEGTITNMDHSQERIVALVTGHHGSQRSLQLKKKTFQKEIKQLEQKVGEEVVSNHYKKLELLLQI